MNAITQPLNCTTDVSFTCEAKCERSLEAKRVKYTIPVVADVVFYLFKITRDTFFTKEHEVSNPEAELSFLHFLPVIHGISYFLYDLVSTVAIDCHAVDFSCIYGTTYRESSEPPHLGSERYDGPRRAMPYLEDVNFECNLSKTEIKAQSYIDDSGSIFSYGGVIGAATAGLAVVTCLMRKEDSSFFKWATAFVALGVTLDMVLENSLGENYFFPHPSCKLYDCCDTFTPKLSGETIETFTEA
jgi:hypothetical protein